jgi:hypothetical protein
LIVDGKSSDIWKWYEHFLDMKLISNAFPTVLFILSGVGEEFTDVWKEYYLGGKYHRVEAVISYPEFDKDKLKE